MTTLVIPQTPDIWPTLGPAIWDWQIENLVYGPGDLRGVRLRDHPPDDEYKGLLYRAYEIHPKGSKLAGRRRFRRVCWSMRKGTAKTEKAAWIAAGELHPDCPVRFDGWDAFGNPVGHGVTDPYIPMVAYTEEQTEELAYGALYFILGNSPLADDFDIGLKRIMRIDGAGKAEPIATAPDAADGARTTWQHFDESHRLVLPRHVETHQVMLANMLKRPLADPWAHETTTSYIPGEGSVAEGTMEYARKVAKGEIKDSKLFFFHRQASDKHDLSTLEGKRAAVVEASGPTAAWSDIDGIVDLALDPQADVSYWERVWLNRPRQAAEQSFDMALFDSLTRRGVEIAPKELVTLGFDGSKFRDATGLVATVVRTGFQFVPTFEGEDGTQDAVWERPLESVAWEVPSDEVDTAIAECFARFQVARLYADPPYWEDSVNRWIGTYGKDHVHEWWTNRDRQMALALRGFLNGMASGEATNDGHHRFRAHMGNARRRNTKVFDDEGKMLPTLRKERKDSPMKIDLAVCATLSWEARGDAIAAGALNEKKPGRLVAF